MSRRDRLTEFGEQARFTVEVGLDVVRAIGVPCLLAGGVTGTCIVEKSCDPVNQNPTDRIGGALHAVLITTSAARDGLVYHADGTPIGNRINGNGETWSNISIRMGSPGNPEDDASAKDVVHRYAKQIVGAVEEAEHSKTAFLTPMGPFQIPNTFETRSAIGMVQDPIRDQSIAIIGLGGTGSYILDLLAKTPVREIHLLDSDHVAPHNLMRAPGAPTAEEIESMTADILLKVDYYHSKYAPLREGIYRHPIRVDSESMFRAFVLDHCIDYAFVCIDQLTEGDSPRQDVVYRALTEAAVPFIDSGLNISVEGRAVRGAITTSAYDAGSMEWEAIPNAKSEGSVAGYRNVQLPEANAMAASLAVMEWRRRTEQYVSESASFLHKFRFERPSIVTPPIQKE